MRLIDADALKETELDFDTDDDCTLFCDAIDNAPTVEAEPVRHGYWIDKFGDGDLYCSGCGAVMEKHEHINHNLYYRYHCGAKMDGDPE